MIIVQTPLRVSLFGGGTDFPEYYRSEGGCVVSFAINKYIFVSVKHRFDDMLRVGYTRTEMVNSVAEIQHDLIREAFQKTGISKGVEITTMGDIPSAGSGLGSSSTVTVGSLLAMYSLLGELVSAERLASEACEIELDVLNRPAGVQDQYIAAYGGFRFIEFQTNGRIICNKITTDADLVRHLNQNLLLFFTGYTRSSGTILTEQKQNISQRLPILRAMKDIALEANCNLQHGNLDAIGELMHQSWLLKKQLATKISNGYIEDLYNEARHAGALGGKITGAGGGGFLLVYCPVERQEAVRVALRDKVELPFRIEQDGAKVIFNYRHP